MKLNFNEDDELCCDEHVLVVRDGRIVRQNIYLNFGSRDALHVNRDYSSGSEDAYIKFVSPSMIEPKKVFQEFEKLYNQLKRNYLFEDEKRSLYINRNYIDSSDTDEPKHIFNIKFNDNSLAVSKIMKEAIEKIEKLTK